MEKKEFKKFMEAQAKEVLKYKRKKDKELGRDTGQLSIIEWIEQNSAKFRKKWKDK